MTEYQPDLFNARPRVPFHKSTRGAARAATMEGAEAIRPRAETLRDRVLAAVERAGIGGMTPDECAASLGETVLAVRPRTTELVQLGLIRRSGERRANASKVGASVLVAVKR